MRKPSVQPELFIKAKDGTGHLQVQFNLCRTYNEDFTNNHNEFGTKQN